MAQNLRKKRVESNQRNNSVGGDSIDLYKEDSIEENSSQNVKPFEFLSEEQITLTIVTDFGFFFFNSVD
jgi:hypothetical protein